MMKLAAFHFLLLASVLLLGVLAVQLWKTLQRPESVLPKVAGLAPGITQRARDFHRSQIKNGRTVWEVSAAEVEYNQSRNEASIRDVTLKWHLEDGQSIGIHSDYGQVRLEGAELRAVDIRGNVEFALGPYALRIPSASYERGMEKISSPGPVSLTGAGLELTGSKLEVDLQTNRLVLQGNVRMVLRPNEMEKKLPQAPS